MYIADRGYTEKLRQIKSEFALSNSAVKVGDIVEDHMGRLRVEKIGTSFTREFPQCVYYGVELTKKNDVKKRQSGRAVYQSNLAK